jgi:hypothetical protein
MDPAGFSANALYGRLEAILHRLAVRLALPPGEGGAIIGDY